MKPRLEKQKVDWKTLEKFWLKLIKVITTMLNLLNVENQILLTFKTSNYSSSVPVHEYNL